jgi:hypothetical protein
MLANLKKIMSPTQSFLSFAEDDASEQKEAYAKVDSAGYEVNKSWCNPKFYSEIIGVDFGGGKMACHKLFAGEDMKGVPIAKARLTLSSMPAGSLVIAERAHLATPQTDKSLSQPFTAVELLALYSAMESKEVTLLLFPHAHTRKARDWAAANDRQLRVAKGKTTDINDARGLAYYVANNNGVALSKPPKDFIGSLKRNYGSLVRAQSNLILNAARVHGYEGQVFPHVSGVASEIVARLPEKELFVDHKVAYSIASLVVGVFAGEPCKYSYKKKIIGWKSWKNSVLLFSSLHHDGGVARSNILWHRFRPAFAKYAKSKGLPVKTGMSYDKFGDLSPSQEMLRREYWAIVRKQVRDAYRIAVELSYDFRSYEILESNGSESTPETVRKLLASMPPEERLTFLKDAYGREAEAKQCQSVA